MPRFGQACKLLTTPLLNRMGARHIAIVWLKKMEDGLSAERLSSWLDVSSLARVETVVEWQTELVIGTEACVHSVAVFL